MSGAAPAAWHREENRFLSFARNVSTRYLAIAVTAVIGLLVLPINVHYLGKSAYGLWMLTAPRRRGVVIPPIVAAVNLFGGMRNTSHCMPAGRRSAATV